MNDLKSLEKDQNYNFNDVKMYCYRQNGVTLAYIAKKFGCSAETVRRKVDKVKRNLKYSDADMFTLSSRAQNGLLQMFDNTIVEITKNLVRDHYEKNPKCFLRQRNLGPKAQEEIVKWINEK